MAQTKQFMYLNFGLLTYLIMKNLAHDEQKTRNKGYRDAIYYYVPETTYHKPSLCIMLIIREPHFHLTLNLNFKGFSQLFSVTSSQYHSFIATYIGNRCPNFHFAAKYFK